MCFVANHTPGLLLFDIVNNSHIFPEIVRHNGVLIIILIRYKKYSKYVKI